MQFLSESLRHQLLKHGSREQLSWMPEIEAHGMEWADVYIGLRGASNIHEHDDIPSEAIALNQGAMGKISRLRWEKTRWCLVRVPNAAFAQPAETDEETIMEMFFSATLLDWEKESGKWREWARRLDAGARARHGKGHGPELQHQGTQVGWRRRKDQHARRGDHDRASRGLLNGQISFEFPGVLSGRLVHNIRLRFEDGMLAEATSSTNQDFLRSVLATDPGASRVGEFAMGTNMAVNRFCKDILLDEKIGGTVHLALGRSYPECGGKNNSALHWDIVKDIRTEGAVLVDGQPVLEKGKFLLRSA